MTYSEIKIILQDEGREMVDDIVEQVGWDVIHSGLICGIPFNEISCYYYGKWDDPTEFAEDYIEQTSSISIEDVYKMGICINWDKTAKELMHSFSEEDGHYFRNY